MGHTIATDAELLTASRRGERAAFGELIERYQPAVCAVTYSRTRDETLAEDVAQDTFLTAWRTLDRVREPHKLGAWLCGIARNLAGKARRRREREVSIEEHVLLATDNPFEAASEAEIERLVGDALGRVPETYRDVLVLHYREHRSARDIAELLEISEAAVLQRLSRGREYLAAGLNALVESSLRRQRVRRNLAASVLAALPAIVPSPVEASPSSHGGNMLKISLAALALAGAGTTALVVHHQSSTPTSSSSSSSPEPAAPLSIAAAPAAVPSAASRPASAVPRPPTLTAAAEADPTTIIAPARIAQLDLSSGPTRGPADAPVTIIMFTDPSCTYCGRAYGTLDELLDEYPTKVRLVVKQFPIKAGSQLSAEAAYAAEAQGKFWEMHDLMYAYEDDLSETSLHALAQQAGLDMVAFADAMQSHSFTAKVTADRDAAKAVDVRGIPSFLINGQRVVGALPISDLRAAIDSALAN
jgi:RNA polymerase sigma factor (sigma-70 family)